MTTIRKIVTSKIDGDGADNTNIGEIRPNNETAFYLDNNNKLTLMMFDGVRTHRRSKVLAPGVLWGSNADAGDDSGSDTIKLIPDAELFAAGSNQYIVVDPTGGEPGHIHLRAGGTQDDSTADLYLGGEQNFVRISDTNDSVTIKTTFVSDGENNYFWNFNSAGILTLPGTLMFDNGTEVSGNSVTVPADSTFEFSLNHYPTASGLAAAGSSPDYLFVDITENDDITVVQPGWQINSGSPSAPIWNNVIETTTIGSEYRINVLGFTFIPTMTYTFRNPTIAESLWQFDEFGNFITPGSGSISHRDNDLKLEVVGGTDVIVLRTAGGDVVVTSAGDLQLDGSIFTGGIVELTNTGVLNTFSPAPGSGYYFNIQSANDYGVSIRSTDLNGDTKDWLFGVDGGLTLPYNNRITVGGDMDTNAINFILQDSLSEDTHQFSFDASNGYPSLSFPDGSFQTTAWSGGRVVDVPTSSTGTTGDLQGDLAFSAGYIYYCIQNFGNSVNLTTLASSGTTVWVSSVGYTGDLVADFTANSTGWTYNGVTINSATADNTFGPGYALGGATGFSVVNGTAYTLIYPSITNIWKRIAWSGDTW